MLTLQLPPALAVDLWWPSGLGPQPLYTVDCWFIPWDAGFSAFSEYVGAEPSVGGASVGGGVANVATRSIGFRVAYLVTANDTAPTTVTGLSGSGGFTFRFKVQPCGSPCHGRCERNAPLLPGGTVLHRPTTASPSH